MSKVTQLISDERVLHKMVGGNKNQRLIKKTSANGDVEWYGTPGIETIEGLNPTMKMKILPGGHAAQMQVEANHRMVASMEYYEDTEDFTFNLFDKNTGVNKASFEIKKNGNAYIGGKLVTTVPEVQPGVVLKGGIQGLGFELLTNSSIKVYPGSCMDSTGKHKLTLGTEKVVTLPAGAITFCNLFLDISGNVVIAQGTPSNPTLPQIHRFIGMVSLDLVTKKVIGFDFNPDTGLYRLNMHQAYVLRTPLPTSKTLLPFNLRFPIAYASDFEVYPLTTTTDPCWLYVAMNGGGTSENRKNPSKTIYISGIICNQGDTGSAINTINSKGTWHIKTFYLNR